MICNKYIQYIIFIGTMQLTYIVLILLHILGNSKIIAFCEPLNCFLKCLNRVQILCNIRV